MPERSDSTQSERQPEDIVHDRLQRRVAATRAAALAAISAPEWICDDGHRHPRPEWFTVRRLGIEVERRNPGNDWSGAEIGLGIWSLRDDGTLNQDVRWRLTVNG